MKKRTAKWIVVSLLFIGGIFYNCSSGLIMNISPRNLEYVKQHAETRWSEMGFNVVGYDGFQWGDCYFKDYGGAKVWYVLKKKRNWRNRKSDADITYGGYLQRWGDEIHMYNLRAYDAIRPQ